MQAKEGCNAFYGSADVQAKGRLQCWSADGQGGEAKADGQWPWWKLPRRV